MNKKPLQIISLGAGVQSTALMIMAERGEITPKPDFAIFSDTQAELPETYEHIEKLKKMVSFPIHTITAGNIEEDFLKAVKMDDHRSLVGRTSTPPFHTKYNGGKGLLFRQCTRDYKIHPIQATIKNMLGYKKGQKMPKDVIQAVIWMGISYDEIQRMKDARVHWIKHTFPLIDRKITRQQCLEYYDKLKLERPVKSSCYFCPYKSNAQWKHHKENQPELLKKLVAFDEKIRDGLNTKKSIGRDGKPIKEAKIYVHGSCKPLKEVDFDKKSNQGKFSFMDECEGMCGV